MRLSTLLLLLALACAVLDLPGVFAGRGHGHGNNVHNGNNNGEDDEDEDDFCSDSARDPEQVDAVTWEHEKEVFRNAYALFAARTANADLTNTSVLNDIGYWLRNYTATIDVGRINRPTGFTVTRSTGLIITNAVSEPPTNNVGIENHNTRYEFMKAQLCRDRGLPIVYDQYFNDRLQKQSRFYAKAIKTGLAHNWHSFRINYNAYVQP